MKLLVFSDSHGNVDNMCLAIGREEPDRVLHLGDVCRDGQKLLAKFPGLALEQVRGNCDGCGGEEPLEKELFVEGKRIWMLHGHTYRVKMGHGLLASEARARGVDVALFGHTHQPLCYLEGSLWVMNPGTIGMPPKFTYGVIELDKGEVSCRMGEI